MYILIFGTDLGKKFIESNLKILEKFEEEMTIRIKNFYA